MSDVELYGNRSVRVEAQTVFDLNRQRDVEGGLAGDPDAEPLNVGNLSRARARVMRDEGEGEAVGPAAVQAAQNAAIVEVSAAQGAADAAALHVLAVAREVHENVSAPASAAVNNSAQVAATVAAAAAAAVAAAREAIRLAAENNKLSDS